jgi:hypothetical protein
MSRGPGRIERAIVALLDEHDGLTAQDLAVMIFHQHRRPGRQRPPSNAEYTTVRRAVARMVQRGDIAYVANYYASRGNGQGGQVAGDYCLPDLVGAVRERQREEYREASQRKRQSL